MFPIKSKHPIVIFDDIDKKMGYWMGFGKNVSPEQVNFMITTGRGLVYVCITEEKAKQLQLPSILKSNIAVSVDLKTVTTGISAYERADTIRAIADPATQPADLNRPGHIIPLIGRTTGFIDRINIAEAAITLAQWVTNEPTAFVCEILNSSGETANENELENLVEEYSSKMIKMSEILNTQLKRSDWLEIIKSEALEFSNQSIKKYKIRNNLSLTDFTMYLKEEAPTFNRLIIYDVCQWGDLLGKNELCKCEKHFKDYLEEMLDGQLDCIIYHRSVSSDPTFTIKKDVLIHQLQKAIKNESVPNSITA